MDLISLGKAQLNKDFLITADTIVVIKGQILGKPRDHQEWRTFLELLSGETHEVITAVTLSYEKNGLEFFVESKVTFATIDNQLMSHYLASNDGIDKAGGYGVQGMGQVFIKKIEGSYSNVVGLPLAELYEKIKKVTSAVAPSLSHFFHHE